MIEDDKQDNGHGVHNDTQDVRPAPLQSCVHIQSSSDWRPKYGEGNACDQDKGVHGSTEGVWNQFTEGDVK